MPPVGSLSFLFSVSQWEAWNLFQMTSNGAPRFGVTEPLRFSTSTLMLRTEGLQTAFKKLGCALIIEPVHEFNLLVGQGLNNSFDKDQEEIGPKYLKVSLLLSHLGIKIVLLSFHVNKKKIYSGHKSTSTFTEPETSQWIYKSLIYVLSDLLSLCPGLYGLFRWTGEENLSTLQMVNLQFPRIFFKAICLR